MLFIYGIRSKEHPAQPIRNVYCKGCGHTNHTARALTRYAHLFWIPFFITSRPLQLVCDNCGNITDKRTLPVEDLRRIRRAFFSLWNTLPYFTGLALLLLTASFAYLGKQETKQQELAMLERPQVNDVYVADYAKLFTDVDMEGYDYGAFKITSLSEDGVSFAMAKVSYKTKYAVKKKLRKGFFKPDEYVSDNEILISHEDVKGLYKSGIFSSIHRQKAAER
ncbi:hypothetical protein [Pseudodesulfovibrio karagichevae]|uniref:Zinc-ribbon 15 domain-containing protein n=1 Tax=Pseudodesulfovibrio karagichevae TaxID=3239305 RepID=A0ABV4K3G9_9BACT